MATSLDDIVLKGSLSISSLTPSKVVLTDATNKLMSSNTSATEIGFVSGVTSNIQPQLNDRMATASYPDLVAIEAITGTSGFLKKIGANTWSLDTSAYLTAPNVKELYNWYAARPTDCNLAVNGNGGIRSFKATSSMTTNKPPQGDSHILHLGWDNTGGWDSQLAIIPQTGQIQMRGQSNGVWSSWATVWDSLNLTNINQLTISDGVFSIAKTSGLQTALDGKAVLASTNYGTTFESTDPFTDTNRGTYTVNGGVRTWNGTGPFGALWYNVVDCRHRNTWNAGATDVYGGELAWGMTNHTDRLAFRSRNASGTPGSWSEVAVLGKDVSFNTIHLASNNLANNIRVGDDAYIGDLNITNGVSLRGYNNSNVGYIQFGGSYLFGFNGTDLVYNNQKVWTNYDFDSTDIGNWDTAYANNHTHNQSLNTTNSPTFTGLTLNGNLLFGNPTNGTFRGIQGTMGVNDQWRIMGRADSDNVGYLEIATSDDGEEPIYVRQYNAGTFATIRRSLTLLDASGNSSFPGNITISPLSGTGTNVAMLNSTGTLIRSSTALLAGSGNTLYLPRWVNSYTIGYSNTFALDESGGIMTITNSGGSYRVNDSGGIVSTLISGNQVLLRLNDSTAGWFCRIRSTSVLGHTLEIDCPDNTGNGGICNLHVTGKLITPEINLNSSNISVIPLLAGVNTLPTPTVGRIIFLYASEAPPGTLAITAPSGYNIRYRSSGTTLVPVAGGTPLTFNSQFGIAVGVNVYSGNPIWHLVF